MELFLVEVGSIAMPERDTERERMFLDVFLLILCNIIRTTWDTKKEKNHYRNTDTEIILVSDITYFGYTLCHFLLTSSKNCKIMVIKRFLEYIISEKSNCNKNCGYLVTI